MKKYIVLWVLIFFISNFSLFYGISLITNIIFVNIFNEFEILLILVGFSANIASILSCTKFISDKILNIKK